MNFPKFNEWLSLREEMGLQVKPDSSSEQEVKKVAASLVGQPKAKRQATYKQLAQKKAMNPASKVKDIEAIATAAEEDS